MLLAAALCSAVSEDDNSVAALSESEVAPVDLRAQALKKVESLIDTKGQEAKPGVAASENILEKKKITMLEDEVHTLKQEQVTIAEKTATDLRATLNQQKEVYFKKMQKASNPTARDRRIAGRAAVQVAHAMDKAGKYRAINKVLTAKAGFAAALQKTVKKLVAKMDAALSATEMMTEKTEKDTKQIKDLKAQVAGLELQVEQGKNGGADDSAKGLSIEKQIKREKKLAREAHKEAAKHSKEAADGHSAAGEMAQATESAKKAKMAVDKASNENLADKAESDEDKAEKEEEKAKSLEKKANKAKKKAEKEKAAAQKVKAAKKKAEKAEEAADKAKDEADAAGDDDSDDEELGTDDSSDDVDPDTAKAMQSDDVEADANEDADDEAEEDDDDSGDDLDLSSFQ